MKKFSLALLTTALLSACGGEQSSQAPASGSQAQAQESTQSSAKAAFKEFAHSYALRGADQSWPGSADDTLVLADNKEAANYYVIFDGSGSMEEQGCGDGQRRIDVAKRAIGTFFDALPKHSNVGLIIFDSQGARDAVPLKPNDPTLLKQITSGSQAGGGTPLGETLNYAHDKLMIQGQKQLGYGEFNIVVLTDGAASDKQMMEDAVADITAKSPINIHTIGFCLGEKHALNKKGVVNYQPAANAAELIKGLKTVLAEAPSFDSESFSDL